MECRTDEVRGVPRTTQTLLKGWVTMSRSALEVFTHNLHMASITSRRGLKAGVVGRQSTAACPEHVDQCSRPSRIGLAIFKQSRANAISLGLKGAKGEDEGRSITKSFWKQHK